MIQIGNLGDRRATTKGKVEKEKLQERYISTQATNHLSLASFLDTFVEMLDKQYLKYHNEAEMHGFLSDRGYCWQHR